MAAAPSRRPKSPAYPGSFPPRLGKIHPISPPCPAMPRRERGTLHPCPDARTPAKLVIANQCAHWCGNPFSPQRSLASWLLFGQIRDALRMRPKCCYFAMPHRRRSGLPRRFTPRNDNGGTSLHPPARSRVPHTLRAKHPCTRAHVLPSACHCEPVRTLVWQSASPQGNRQAGTTLGKSVALSRIRPKYCFLSCPAAGVTDCPVASLLAMTCRNMRLSAVATAWCQANLSRFRIRPRRYFLLCPAAGEADCHVASLLAMTCCNMPLPAWQGRFPKWQIRCAFPHSAGITTLAPAHTPPPSAATANPVLAPAHTSFLLHVIANQCAHWCGNPFSPQGNPASWLLFGQIRSTSRIRPKYYFLLRPAAGLRIATSLRSSQ